MEGDDNLDPSSGSELGGEAAAGAADSEARAAAAGEESEGGEGEGEEGQARQPVSITKQQYDRVNGERHKAARALGWYQENVGTPDDVLAFKKWKAENAKNGGDAGRSDANQPLPAEKRDRLNRLIRETNPELYQLQERLEEREKALDDAKYDHAEETIASLGTADGLPMKDDNVRNFVGQLTLLAIRGDERLMKRWLAHDTTVVPIAYKRVVEQFITPLRRMGAGQVAGVRRQVSNLNTPPAGGRSVSSGKPREAEKGKGLGFKDPTLADRAWDRLNAGEQ